jgi:hypothetical protein
MIRVRNLFEVDGGRIRDQPTFFNRGGSKNTPPLTLHEKLNSMNLQQIFFLTGYIEVAVTSQGNLGNLDHQPLTSSASHRI